MEHLAYVTICNGEEDSSSSTVERFVVFVENGNDEEITDE